MSSTYQDFSNFLRNSSWWLALILLGLLLLAIALILLLGGKGEKKGKKKHSLEQSEYLLALGGNENVKGHELRGSRIVVDLVDPSKVDQAKLKEIGVDAFILMSEKVTLVIQGDAEKVYRAIFGAAD